MHGWYFHELLCCESRMWMLYFKPSSFCGNETSCYPRDIVEILIKLNGGVFLSNYNNVIFTWIISARYLAINNEVMYLILTSFSLSLINISLHLQSHVSLDSYWIAWILLSSSWMVCWWSSWISSILESKLCGTMSFRMCSFGSLHLFFQEFTMTYMTP